MSPERTAVYPRLRVSLYRTLVATIEDSHPSLVAEVEAASIGEKKKTHQRHNKNIATTTRRPRGALSTALADLFKDDLCTLVVVGSITSKKDTQSRSEVSQEEGGGGRRRHPDRGEVEETNDLLQYVYGGRRDEGPITDPDPETS